MLKTRAFSISLTCPSMKFSSWLAGLSISSTQMLRQLKYRKTVKPAFLWWGLSTEIWQNKNRRKDKWEIQLSRKAVSWKMQNSVWMWWLLSGIVEGQHRKHKVKMGKKKPRLTHNLILHSCHIFEINKTIIDNNGLS